MEPEQLEAGGLPDEEREAFLSVCQRQNIPLSAQQIDLLDRYVADLLHWNKKINLISRKDEANIWEKHISHCISLLFAVHIPSGGKMVDIGSGGGLPGIPINILRPDLTFLLIDATRKKTEAVSEIIKGLGLKGIEIIWGRAEEVALRPQYRSKFDFAFARGVASLSELIDWTKPFLNDHPEGARDGEQKTLPQLSSPALLAFKGGDLSDEVRKAEQRHRSVTIRVLDLHYDTKRVQDGSEKKLVVVNW